MTETTFHPNQAATWGTNKPNQYAVSSPPAFPATLKRHQSLPIHWTHPPLCRADHHRPTQMPRLQSSSPMHTAARGTGCGACGTFDTPITNEICLPYGGPGSCSGGWVTSETAKKVRPPLPPPAGASGAGLDDLTTLGIPSSSMAYVTWWANP